jgi:mannose-6-phosphate isomerase-like protein (cupin superfamily)
MMRFIPAGSRPFVPASHEDPERPGVYRRLIAARDELSDGRVQMINWAHLPVGHAFRAHYHEDMEETFVIIAGRCTMEVDGTRQALERGDALIVAAREVHSMQNTGNEPVDYLVVGVSRGRHGRTVVVD